MFSFVDCDGQSGIVLLYLFVEVSPQFQTVALKGKLLETSFLRNPVGFCLFV